MTRGDGRRSTPRGGRVLALALGVGLVGALVVGAEIVLRVVDPDLRVGHETAFPEIVDHLRNVHHEPDPTLLWRARPGYAGAGLRISSAGFREDPEGGDPARYDVACLGNSVTFGYTTPGYADTYPALLETRLSARCHAPIEVLNAGIIGYTSAQGRILYREHVAELSPRVVTILYGYNDHHLSPASDADKLANAAGTRAGGLLDELRVYRALLKVAATVRPPRVEGALEPRVAPDALAANLSALVAAVRAAGAVPILVTVPIRPSVPLVENPVRVRTGEGRTRWAFQARWLTAQLPREARGPLTRLLYANEPMDPELLIALGPGLERLAAAAPDEWPLPRYVLGLALEAAGEEAAAAAAFAEAAARDTERAAMEAVNATIRSVAAATGTALADVAADLAAHPEAFSDVVHTNASGNARIAAMMEDAVAAALGCGGDGDTQ